MKNENAPNAPFGNNSFLNVVNPHKSDVAPKKTDYFKSPYSTKAPRSYYKVSQREIWLTIFYSIYRLIVAGVERKSPWDLIP
ncbi:hypothetical protein, partial [Viridibacillus arvi]|uniref:hypothetical protein n=1 Tax=Viridibacillus arvi TaxID=263475 RepID=UPI003D05BD74